MLTYSNLSQVAFIAGNDITLDFSMYILPPEIKFNPVVDPCISIYAFPVEEIPDFLITENISLNISSLVRYPTKLLLENIMSELSR